MNKKISIIGAAMGWGSRNSGCEKGAEVLLNSSHLKLFLEEYPSAGLAGILASQTSGVGKRKPPEVALPFVADFNQRLCEKVGSVLRHDGFPVVLGGDHSIAMGTWSAVTAHLEAQDKFGLIWMDAHMDAHTPKTRDEGKWGGKYHGQPLAVLLGEGEEELTSIGASGRKISPEHVCLIGIRSYEPGERAFLESLGVRVFYMDEVEKRGFQAVFDEALEIATSGTKGFGVSVDLDGFDPQDAPAVGTREKGGFRKKDVLKSFEKLTEKDGFLAFEITEFNPSRDKNKKTEELVYQMLSSIFNEK